MTQSLYHNKKAQWAAYAAVFLLIALVPYLFENPFVINQIARYVVFAMLAVSVSLVWGYGGILSLGQGLAFGIAAYGMGMTMQMQFQNPETDPIPSFMLTNELDYLPWIWQPFWSTPLGLFLTLAVPTAIFLGLASSCFRRASPACSSPS